MSTNIETLTIAEAREIAALFGSLAKSEPAKQSARVEGDSRPVIVRAKDAGVHFGYLTAYEGRMVWLTNSRRLWSWTANSGVALSGVATTGINASKSKVDALVNSIVILDACEIIDATDAAAKTIEAA